MSDFAVSNGTPVSKITHQMCIDAVRELGSALEFGPDHEMMSDLIHRMFTEAVKKNHLTSEELLEMVKKNGLDIDSVPDHMMTLEMIFSALENDGRAIMLVPKKMLTPEMYLKSVEQNGWCLDLIPRSERTLGIYLTALKSYARTLEYIEKETSD